MDSTPPTSCNKYLSSLASHNRRVLSADMCTCVQGMRRLHSPVTPPSYPNNTPPLAAMMQANTTYVVVFASTSITPAAARSMSAALRILEEGTYSSPVLEVILGLPIFADCLSITAPEQSDCTLCCDTGCEECWSQYYFCEVVLSLSRDVTEIFFRGKSR